MDVLIYTMILYAIDLYIIISPLQCTLVYQCMKEYTILWAVAYYGTQSLVMYFGVHETLDLY